LLEQQRMSIDQYLLMMKKTREEYLKDIEPDAEKRVKRELVLDQVASQEQISILPEEVEAIFRAYEQAGQPLPRTEAQIRAIVVNYRREKTVTRLVELTTDPDPAEEVAEEEISMENAEAAALAGETVNVEDTVSTETEDVRSQTDEAEVRGTDDTAVDVVE
jgi:trigger factor